MLQEIRKQKKRRISKAESRTKSKTVAQRIQSATCECVCVYIVCVYIVCICVCLFTDLLKVNNEIWMEGNGHKHTEGRTL